MSRRGKGGFARIILGIVLGRAVVRNRFAGKIVSRSANAARLVLVGRLFKRLISTNTRTVQVRTDSAVVSVEPR